MAARRHLTYLRPRRPRPRWRRVLGWILFVLCLPPLAWLAWNRIDEAPNADAQRWGNPPVREVADAHNAWLYLLGIGAAEGDDPVAFGRRRVDAYVARARRDPMAAADPLEDDRNAPVPYVGTVEGIDGIAQLCPRRGTNCIDWAAAHRPALERLADANRLRLQRLDSAIALPQWKEAPLLSGDFPTPSVQLVAAKLNLLALDANDSNRLGRSRRGHRAPRHAVAASGGGCGMAAVKGLRLQFHGASPAPAHRLVRARPHRRNATRCNPPSSAFSQRRRRRPTTSMSPLTTRSRSPRVRFAVRCRGCGKACAIVCGAHRSTARAAMISCRARPICLRRRTTSSLV